MSEQQCPICDGIISQLQTNKLELIELLKMPNQCKCSKAKATQTKLSYALMPFLRTNIVIPLDGEVLHTVITSDMIEENWNYIQEQQNEDIVFKRLVNAVHGQEYMCGIDSPECDLIIRCFAKYFPYSLYQDGERQLVWFKDARRPLEPILFTVPSYSLSPLELNKGEESRMSLQDSKDIQMLAKLVQDSVTTLLQPPLRSKGKSRVEGEKKEKNANYNSQDKVLLEDSHKLQDETKEEVTNLNATVGESKKIPQEIKEIESVKDDNQALEEEKERLLIITRRKLKGRVKQGKIAQLIGKNIRKEQVKTFQERLILTSSSVSLDEGGKEVDSIPQDCPASATMGLLKEDQHVTKMKESENVVPKLEGRLEQEGDEDALVALHAEYKLRSSKIEKNEVAQAFVAPICREIRVWNKDTPEEQEERIYEIPDSMKIYEVGEERIKQGKLEIAKSVMEGHTLSYLYVKGEFFSKLYKVRTFGVLKNKHKLKLEGVVT